MTGVSLSNRDFERGCFTEQVERQISQRFFNCKFHRFQCDTHAASRRGARFGAQLGFDPFRFLTNVNARAFCQVLHLGDHGFHGV